ncbi:2'-5' RNA ligase family protein [Streptomyces sp. NPDC055506]
MASGRTTNAFICLRVPSELVDALVDLQREFQDRVDPQYPEHIHITLGFLHGADDRKLADARSFISEGVWSAPAVRLTGEVRHGSWTLRKNPSYRYDEATVQMGEQVRLGVEHSPELARIQQDITQHLNIVEDGFWPHVTLGLAREDFPASEVKALRLPSVSGAAPAVDMQQEASATSFTTLVRNDFSA